MSADETEAGIAPADETVVVAPIVDYPETPAAWSLADTEPVEVRSWASTWGHAAAIAGICVAVAFAICVLGVAIVIASSGRGRPVPIQLPQMPTSSLPVPPTPAALPSVTIPPSPPSHPVAASPDDDEFVAIAISPLSIAVNDAQHAGAWGTSGTQQGADRIAILNCKKASGHTDCVPVNAGMFHGCVSFAIYGQIWAGGAGDSQAGAILDAKSNLRAAGGQSELASVSLAVECSTPPGKSDSQVEIN